MFRTSIRHTSWSGSQTTSSLVSATFTPMGLKLAVTFLGNTTAIQELFKRFTEVVHDDSSKPVSCVVEEVSIPTGLHGSV